VQSAAVGAVALPCALFAHLLATGTTADLATTTAVVVVVLAAGAVAPARTAARLALVTALAQVAAQSVLALLTHGGGPGQAPACIPVVGRAASLGLQLAVLDHDPACPTGTVTVQVTAAAVLAAATAAVIVVAGHALVAVLSGLALGRATAAATLVTALAGVVRRVFTRTRTLLVLLLGPFPAPRRPAARPRVDRTEGLSPRRWWAGPVVSRRGPPATPALAR